ncbi:DUF6457 domain-containing protein [Nocardioides acrostichi]|uniref:DUF6457 domain-containing protein n=1 Tax=Nocardioides acrostichi TaxID=2784339 RepID=A0A930V4R9_9ACTN|nr:DUF6457 domain-containing protein [Nocardioides acrostichi]MBF4163740.1 hypothetical protein [Nocardioides acrostichi]
MNLHDWIDELCDVLDIDAEVDEGLVLDLAKLAAHQVARPAAPLTAFLLGYAAGEAGGAPEVVEELADRAKALAESWDQPADTRGENLSGDDLPELEDLDDDTIDHESEEE